MGFSGGRGSITCDKCDEGQRFMEIDGGACGAVLELKEERDRSGAGAARSGSSESQRALRHPTPAETRQAFAGRPHESRIRGQRVQDPATLRLPVVPSEGSLCGFCFCWGGCPSAGWPLRPADATRSGPAFLPTLGGGWRQQQPAALGGEYSGAGHLTCPQEAYSRRAARGGANTFTYCVRPDLEPKTPTFVPLS